MGRSDGAPQARLQIRGEPEPREGWRLRVRVEDPHHHAFTKARGQTGQPEIHWMAIHRHRRPPVLRKPRLRHIQIPQQFESGRHRRLQ